MLYNYILVHVTEIVITNEGGIIIHLSGICIREGHPIKHASFIQCSYKRHTCCLAPGDP